MRVGKLFELGQLVVKCKKCEALYPSGIIVDDAETVQKHPERFRDVETKCPFCGHENKSGLGEIRFTVL
jgi:hypothetical protein